MVPGVGGQEEGVSVLNVTFEHSFSLDVVLSIVPYIRMQYPALVLQIGILPFHCDAHIAQFDGFRDRLMTELFLVLSVEILPEEWLPRLMRLLA